MQSFYSTANFFPLKCRRDSYDSTQWAKTAEKACQELAKEISMV